MKKTLIIVGIVFVLGVAYWLLSPFWRDKFLDEDLPGLKKAMEMMTLEQKKDFIEQMEKTKGLVIEKSEPMIAETVVLKSSDLVPEAHKVEGRGLIVESNGQKFLRFENLKTINGPDLRIYLSSDLGVSDAIDLGPIKATSGNVNYQLPVGIDIEKYRNALIWCRAFRVLFSYGRL